MKRNFEMRVAKVLNVILVAAAFSACWFGYYVDHIYAPFWGLGNWAILSLFVVLYIIFVSIYDGYQVSLSRASVLIYSQGLAVLVSDGIMFIVLILLTRGFPNILPALGTLGGQVVVIVFWCAAVRKWYHAAFPAKRVAIIYGAQQNVDELIAKHKLTETFEICAKLPIGDCLADLSSLQDVEAVFLINVYGHERDVMLKYCVAHSVSVYIAPYLSDVLTNNGRWVNIRHSPILYVVSYHPTFEYLFFKRLADILISLVMIVVTSPIMLVIALAIKLCDGGPVFYKQARLTRDGKVFNILKFRSMRVDAEQDGVARLSTGDQDDRVTPVGRVIRKIRGDELPQLLNILRGDMSFVGPRPERPEIAEEYYKTVPEFRMRLQAKAGLTGYAQVYGQYNTDPYDKLQMDMIYIAHASLLTDLKLIFATVKILFMAESTEGVKVETAREKSNV